VTVYSPLFAGGSMILLKGFSPKDCLPKLERYQATAFSGVPTVYAILNNLPDAGQYDLSKLRFCICGAAPMPVEVFETFERKYKAFILEGYGLSEGTCASSINPLDAPRKIGSIGLPLAGQELKIFDDNDRELPRGEIGEIVVKGENVMQGYYHNPEATAATLKNGWLHTGDLGHQDKDGYFFIKGRKKEMIIRGGENIYPKEIEEVLYKHPAVLDAAVVGLPDKIWGEEVAAFIVPKPGQEVKDTEIIEYCKGKLANYKCPRMVFSWDQLPKTATGKIQKNRIVEKYLKQKGE
jgi:long-chain acyl-CoA synthetase